MQVTLHHTPYPLVTIVQVIDFSFCNVLIGNHPPLLHLYGAIP